MAELISESTDIEGILKGSEVIFRPNAGSQSFFLTCPAFEVLITGTRGSGKTLVLLMDFLRDVGVGWGAAWRGIIFRQTYKQLFDVITKAHEWIPQIFPEASFNVADMRWTFPDGEQLLFRYMERPSDYWNYHGWEIPWCVSSDTEVLMSNGEYLEISEIVIGDEVWTLQGSRLVTNVVELKGRKEVQARVYNGKGELLGFQSQGVDHCLLASFLRDYSGSSVGTGLGSFLDYGDWSFHYSGSNIRKLGDLGINSSAVLLWGGEGSDYIRWLHPYSSEYWESLGFSGSIGLSYCVPTSDYISMFDLRVQGASHYLTRLKGSNFCVVNSNCGWEELTNFPTSEAYDSIKSICRSSHAGVPKRYRATTNPYGVGAYWVKERFIDIADSCRIYTDEEGGTRCWIDSGIEENIPLLESDPNYLNRLKSSITDEGKRKAWIEGSWDVSVGGIFSDVWDRGLHVIKPFEIPKGWYIDVTYDYGSSSPFAICFFAEVTNDSGVIINGEERFFPLGTIFNIVEYYGFTGKANEGLRMDVVEIAREVRNLIECHHLLSNHVVYPGAADASIFSSESNLPSIARRMLRFKKGSKIEKGIRWKRSVKTKGSRIHGVEIFRNLLRSSKGNSDGVMEEPGFFVFDTCRNFIRTVPILTRDPKVPDDVNTLSEDHIWDAVRYRLLDKKIVINTQEV